MKTTRIIKSLYNLTNEEIKTCLIKMMADKEKVIVIRLTEEKKNAKK